MSKQTRNSILETLRNHKAYMKEAFGVEKIGLFGSYARGEETETSDIDLLVKMPSDFDRFYDLKTFLESKFDKTIDLGQETSLRRFIRKRIESEIVYA